MLCNARLEQKQHILQIIYTLYKPHTTHKVCTVYTFAYTFVTTPIVTNVAENKHIVHCVALNTLCGITQKVSNYYTEKCQFFAFILEKFTPDRKNLHEHRSW